MKKRLYWSTGEEKVEDICQDSTTAVTADKRIRNEKIVAEVYDDLVQSLGGSPLKDPFRSSRPQMFFKIGVPEHFENFRKRDSNTCFPEKFVKFLRALFLQNISGGCFWSFRISSTEEKVKLKIFQ